MRLSNSIFLLLLSLFISSNSYALQTESQTESTNNIKSKEKTLKDGWQLANLKGRGALYSVAYGNNTFISVGDNAAYRSIDNGKNWQKISLPNKDDFNNSKYLTSIAFGNNMFVIVGIDGVTYQSDDNGITWNISQTYDLVYLRDICFGDGVFIAVGDGAIYRSTNGLNWNVIKENKDMYLSNISYLNNVFIAISDDKLYKSFDGGISWNAFQSKKNSNFNLITHTDSSFITINKQGIIYQSKDNGLSWKYAQLTKENNEFLNGISYGNNYLVATTLNGTTYYRKNTDKQWTSIITNKKISLLGVSYANGVFTAFGNDMGGQSIIYTLSTATTQAK